MRTLNIDIETYSSINLATSGVYTYTEAKDFDILLFGYSIDGTEPQVIDLAHGEQLPDDVLAALTDAAVTKIAFNASFERICISAWLHQHHPHLIDSDFLDPAQWRCTMITCAYLGLPLSLEHAAIILGLEEQKDSRGKKLIRQFCTPAKDGQAMLPSLHTQDWLDFKAYNAQDVRTELAISKRLEAFIIPEAEWATYALDQHINDTGILIDLPLAHQAITCDQNHRAKTLARAQELTGLENPNSPLQLKAWLTENGCTITGLTKAEVTEALTTATGITKEVLELRGELAKSSVKKYQAMTQVAGKDGRARGLIQFYGASRTGRFAGRLIQVQNLPRNYLPDLESARNLLGTGNHEALELLYPSVPDTLSQLIRTAFIPTPGSRFVVADFSAIEARVIAWLAGEDWRLRLFKQGGDIYCQSASHMFGVPVEKHGVNAELRQKGKISELACGYGGSVGALKAMGALTMGLTEAELKPLVDAWRAANPMIVQLWWDLEEAITHTVTTRAPSQLGPLTITWEAGVLFIQLPSGRRLTYIKPRLTTNRFGSTSIEYDGVLPTKKWGAIESYGGKFTENVVQAIARDLLTHALHQVAEAGHRIVMHIHDEIVVETSTATVEDICQLMTQAPAWAAGLPLDADGYECSFYMKG